MARNICSNLNETSKRHHDGTRHGYGRPAAGHAERGRRDGAGQGAIGTVSAFAAPFGSKPL